MPDPMFTAPDSVPDPIDAFVAALRAPVPTNLAATTRIMIAVREMAREAPLQAAPERRLSVRALREASGGPLATSTGLAAAAGVAALIALGALKPSDAPRRALATRIAIGDTVASALRDTMRLVRFVLRAPFASSVAIAGDFNTWSPKATKLERDAASDLWSVVVSLAPGQHGYAFVVNDTQWVHDPGARAAAPHQLAPPHSIIDVR